LRMVMAVQAKSINDNMGDHLDKQFDQKIWNMES
jgi:hypothetical protein